LLLNTVHNPLDLALGQSRRQKTCGPLRNIRVPGDRLPGDRLPGDRLPGAAAFGGGEKQWRRAVRRALSVALCALDIGEQERNERRRQGKCAPTTLTFGLGIRQHEPPLLLPTVPLAHQIAHVEERKLDGAQSCGQREREQGMVTLSCVCPCKPCLGSNESG